TIKARSTELVIRDYPGFSKVIIEPGDSLAMNGSWIHNQTGTQISTAVEKFSFREIFLETVKLNQSRFENVNRIRPGDTIFLPPLYKGGYPSYLIAQRVDLLNRQAEGVKRLNKHDCIWRICERYHAGELKTTPIEVTITPALPVETTEVAESKNLDWLIWLLGILLFASILYSIMKYRRDLNRDPENFPPVIPGGLSNNDQAAVNQIQQRLPEGSRVTRLERGTIRRLHGPRKVLTTMHFGDGQRPAYIKPGEKVVRVTIQGRNGQTSVQYWRSHCGNSFSIIARDNFILPDGWEFLIDSTLTPQATEAAANGSEAPVAQNENAEANAPALTKPEAAKPQSNGHAVTDQANPNGEAKIREWKKFAEMFPKENIARVEFSENPFSVDFAITYHKNKKEKTNA
ncbi:hypothetical protein CVU83_03170, partial [Candidatus Falkowbacteria bacterium HGW-Falkowbacteria-2]